MSSPLPAQAGPVAIPRWLSSPSSFYEVESVLGQGAFGRVVKCTRLRDKKTVAIKMMQNQGSLVDQARAEVAALRNLKTLDPDKCNIVRWYQDFTSSGHNCLEFEHLDKSLRDLMKERNNQPLLLKEIRPIVQQLATALHHLKSVGMFHADLKLENVVLENHAQEPYRVKVIDFGLAGKMSAARVGSYIQTRYYRSPEIILGLPFTEAIDMWSLGCIAAELYLGFMLFPGSNEYDMMRYITQTLGTPPQDQLSLGTKTGQFFQRVETTGRWKLKTPEQFQAETGTTSLETRVSMMTSLYDLLNINDITPENPAGLFAERLDRLIFVNILHAILDLDAARRVTPEQVLEHPFLTMSHLSSMDPLNSHIMSCVQLMDVCQKETQTSDSGTAAGGSPKPSSSRTSCTETKPVRSGVKRRADDDDDERRSETSHQSKRRRSEWHSSRSSCQDPSTSSQRSGSQRRDDDRKRFWKGSSSSHSSSCQDPSISSQRSGSKRRDDDRKRFWKGSSSSHSSRSQDPSTSSQRSGSQRPDEDRKRFWKGSSSSHSSCQDPSTSSQRSGSKRPDDDRKRFWKGSSSSHSRSCQDPSTSSQRSGSQRPDDDRKRFWNGSSSSSRGSSSLTANKMARSEDHRRSHRESESTSGAGPSSSSSSSSRRCSPHDPAAGRSHGASTSSSTQTESRARSGHKRKAEDDDEDVPHGTSDLDRRKMRRRDT